MERLSHKGKGVNVPYPNMNNSYVNCWAWEERRGEERRGEERRGEERRGEERRGEERRGEERGRHGSNAKLYLEFSTVNSLMASLCESLGSNLQAGALQVNALCTAQ